MSMTCSICAHPQRQAIDAAVASGGLSLRNIAQQFGLIDHTSLYRHKSHLARRVVDAVARAGEKADDVFMQRHEHLYAETLQYVEDAKQAVKMQRVTVEAIGEDGRVQRHEAYQAMRDVGAMAPALQTAVQLQRVLGDATARFSQAAGPGSVNIALQLVIPRDLSPQAQSDLPVAIEVQALPPDPTEPSE